MPGTPSATLTTFQIGTINPLTGAFTSVFDCNDRSATFLRENGLSLPEPPLAEARSFNIRTPGESVPAQQYKNRQISYAMLLKASTPAGLWTAVRSLRAAIATKPFAIRIALPGGAGYVSAVCVKCTTDVPTDPKQILAKTITTIHLVFECLPGLLGDRQVLDNALQNPGFEAPSGPGVQVFSDPLANFNAYTVQAGGALSQDKTTFVDVLHTMPGLLRHFRLNEASGTTAYDAQVAGNGTATAGVTFNSTALLAGDATTSCAFNGTSGTITFTPNSLPTGNSPWWLLAVIKTPAAFSATYMIQSYGAQATTRGAPQIYIDNTGKVHAGTSGGDTSGFTLAASTIYLIGAQWDGTNLTLWVNGVQQATAAPGALAVAATYGTIGGTAAASPLNFYSGNIQESAWGAGTLTSAQWTSLANAVSAAPATNPNSLVIPANGRVSFGSANWANTGNWGGVNQWLVRFKYQTNQVISCYLPYASSANYNLAQFNAIAGGTLALYNNWNGSTTTIATKTAHLVPGVEYWLQVTLFPTMTGSGYIYVQASLCADTNGVAGTVIATLTGSMIVGFTGNLQIQAGGAALGLTAHSVNLWGPGGWWFLSAGTGIALGDWEQSANLYASGPWPSSGAASLHAPASGSLSAAWRSGDPTSVTTLQQTAIAVSAPGDTVSFSAQCYAPSVSATCVNSVYFAEYDGNGNLLRTGGNAANRTGPLAAYTAISGNYATGANCAYALMFLSSVDSAGASANAQIWWENAQGWDQTSTGMTAMPYCETRFPQSPAQILLSGIAGDLPAPALVAFGAYETAFSSGNALTYGLGRKGVITAPPANASPTTMLLGPLQSYLQFFIPTLDPTSYGGVYAVSSTLTGFEQDTAYLTNTLCKGAYHYFSRLYTTQSAGNLSNIKAQGMVLQKWNGQTSVAFGNSLFPFSASATWSVLDLGLIRLPFAQPGVSTDLSQTSTDVAALWKDSSGSGAVYRMNWWMLLPIDAGVLYGQILNPALGPTISNQWIWIYADGQGLALGLPTAWGWSAETGALAAPAHAQGGAGAQNSSSSSISINPAADNSLMLDPMQATSQAGVNLLSGVITDNTGAVLPLHVSLIYTPLYLNPR